MTAIRPFTEHDLNLLPAFKPPDWSDITAPFRYYLASENCDPVVLQADEEAVAIGAAIAFPGTGWIGHIIVARGNRRRGFGTAVVNHLLEHLSEARRCRTVSLIASDEGRPLYQSLGFRDQETYRYLERPTGEYGGPAVPRDSSVRAARADDLPSILELDRIVSGEDRRSLLAQFMDGALVYAGEGVVSGFYLPALRDGLIVAVDIDAGRALMDVRRAASNRAILPASNRAGYDHLNVHNFRETTTGKRMIRGEGLSWRPECIYNRIGGNFG